VPKLDEDQSLSEAVGIFDVLSGVSRLAQVQNIDMTIPALLVKINKQTIDALKIKNYFMYILMSVTVSVCLDAVEETISISDWKQI
jgi:O-antigen biosynthesis protein WbqP